MSFSRREFLTSAVLSSAALSLEAQGIPETATPMQDHAGHAHPKPERPKVARVPAVLSRITGTAGLDAAYSCLKAGRDTLQAALQITQAQEDYQDDATAGLGGLPNASGEVQLDACCFHGPTRRTAAVGAVQGIKNASLLAHTLMERTAYPMLVGEDAQRFALTRSFVQQELLTRRTRAVWELWKQLQFVLRPLGAGIYDPAWPEPDRETHFLPASQDELNLLVRKFEPLAVKAGIGPQWTWRAVYDALFPAANPLYVSTVNEKQEISCAATTSGLPWRMPGATSDIANPGTGCYLDPEVGSAGASGNAAANIKIGGARLIVENMRQGMTPEEAGMDALRKLVQWYRNDIAALRFVEVLYYVQRKDGAYSCVSLWHGDRTGHAQQFAIHDGVRRTEECLFLLEGNPPNGLSTSLHTSIRFARAAFESGAA
ncbi:L-asparaginase [Acidisarcina polymorpha]|uniref:L-asparaginase n=1 Tax=Acidisarcina polymorpha TaxID=2211140 RepID=A0A2Z5FYX3_9BACT|nr:isoaspartyl peptidase/L-asparaginase [Acidisarcina polymorpha]AXC12048.1 L-asparaginase [Acidisarcina polymorpha]